MLEIRPERGEDIFGKRRWRISRGEFRNEAGMVVGICLVSLMSVPYGGDVL